MKVLLYLETYFLPGDVNMALDVELGKVSFEKNEPILRIYTWERPTLSIGKHQDVKEIDLRSLRKLGIDCVRRPTGGRAVLHWNEITYSVLFPKGSEEFGMSVIALYRKVSEILARALRNAGVDVDVSSGKGWAPKNPSCFSSSSRYELTIGGKKVVGSAQVRKKDFVLQHGSIMLNPRWDMLSEVLSSHPPVEVLSKKATGILESKKIGFRDLVESIFESFDMEYGLEWMKHDEVMNVLRRSSENRGEFRCRSST